METKKTCSDCGETSRRDFLKTTALAAAAIGAPSILRASTADGPEALAKAFHKSLTDGQRKAVAFPWDEPRRMKVMNNWEIVPQQIGKFYNADQQQLVRDIFKGMVSPDGHERFMKSMKDDYGGIESYHVATFGEPESGKYAFVLTGRHVTMRCDADAEPGVVFGGPIFYGHATTFNEKPDHPGNAWWSQARLANKIYGAFDGKQREAALVEKSLPDNARSVRIRTSEERLGIAVSTLSADQKGLVNECLKDFLSMYRASDVAEAMKFIDETGGVDALHLAFHKEGDLGDDQIWDRFIVQGPAMTWYFRGSPHVHTWVNFQKA